MLLYYANCSDRKLFPWVYEHDIPLLYSQFYARLNLDRRFDNDTSKGEILVDSGAHTAHTHGGEVDVDSYIDYINQHIDKTTLCVQVDKIPGLYRKPKTQKDWEDAPRLSWENYCYMREKLSDPNKLVPVFHQGEDFSWLENLCNSTFDGQHIPYIGLSPRGDVSLEEKYNFCADCFSVISRTKNPKVHTHCFGATSLAMLERLPFTSADSTTWVLVAAYGQVWIPSGITGECYDDSVGFKLGISVENQAHPTSTQTYWQQSEETKAKIREYIESKGFTLEQVAGNHWCREIMNLLFCQDWVANYQYKGVKSFNSTKMLF